MITVVLTEKPVTGRLDRVCKVCGENYFGWNFVACQKCEAARNYTVEEAWR